MKFVIWKPKDKEGREIVSKYGKSWEVKGDKLESLCYYLIDGKHQYVYVDYKPEECKSLINHD